MYQLYINEEHYELKISPLKSTFKNQEYITNSLKDAPYEICYYNDNYRFCGKRAPLVELAMTIRDGWLRQAKSMVQKIEEIKI